MSDTLQFELVTPEKLAVSKAVAMVEVPGEMGDFGVLPGHAPFMSIIRPGVISVHEAGDSKTCYFVPAGYAEVNPDGCIVLAEHIRDMADVTVEQAEKELEIAKLDFEEAKEDADKKLAAKAYDVAQVFLAAAKNK